MTPTQLGRPWIVIGSLSGFLGVSMGAFGAHGLAEKLSPRALSIFQTGAQYQMYHAFALILLGILSSIPSETSSTTVESTRWTKIAGRSFLWGTVLFSGSLYSLAITGIKALGMITPFGGLAFLLGWLAFAKLATRLQT